MYLANIVFWETYCILNCDYCMYTKSIRKVFSSNELSVISENIHGLRNFIDEHADTVQVISLTWWEPTMFPDVIWKFYEAFQDKIIRVSTNGLLVDMVWIERFSPEQIYFAVTLDGIDLETNNFRFKSQIMLDKILSNIDMLLKKWFSVEILTVLSPLSMLQYTKLLKFFEERYRDQIEDGKLWFIPIELINYRNEERFQISKELRENFIQQITSSMDWSLILSKYDDFFWRMIEYYSDKSVESCGMYKWWLHFKFLGNSIWTNWNFYQYACWSRWHLMMGVMNLKNKFDKMFILERRKTDTVEKYFSESSKACKSCFDNWHFYWLLLQWKLRNVPWILKKTLDSYHQ